MRSWLIGTFTLVVADFFLKQAVLKRPPLPRGRFDFLLTWTLHKNTGAVFNWPVPMGVLLVGSFVALGILGWTLWKFRKAPAVAVPLLFLTMGGAGNFLDRLLHGFTTDYLLFFRRSAWNLSDALLVAGVVSLFVSRCRSNFSKPRQDA